LAPFVRDARAQCGALRAVSEQNAPGGGSQVWAREESVELPQLGAGGELVAPGARFTFAAKSFESRGAGTAQELLCAKSALAFRCLAPHRLPRFEAL